MRLQGEAGDPHAHTCTHGGTSCRGGVLPKKSSESASYCSCGSIHRAALPRSFTVIRMLYEASHVSLFCKNACLFGTMLYAMTDDSSRVAVIIDARARFAQGWGRQQQTNNPTEGFKTFTYGDNSGTASSVISSLFGSYPREVILRLKQLMSRSSSPRQNVILHVLYLSFLCFSCINRCRFLRV